LCRNHHSAIRRHATVAEAIPKDLALLEKIERIIGGCDWISLHAGCSYYKEAEQDNQRAFHERFGVTETEGKIE
jgi:hypothetical protein